MDCQTGLVAVYSNSQDEFIKRASGVLKAARALEMLVIQVQVGFRTGLPEMSSRNKLLGAIKSSRPHQEFFQGLSGAIHPGTRSGTRRHHLDQASCERICGGTDLDMLLRANEIETIVLFGIATSGVVLSTLLQASDADYRLVVISDCCDGPGPGPPRRTPRSVFSHTSGSNHCRRIYGYSAAALTRSIESTIAISDEVTPRATPAWDRPWRRARQAARRRRARSQRE